MRSPVSLGASWSLDTRGPRCSQGKPEGDEVISGLGLCEPGPSWRQWGAGLAPEFWEDPPWVPPPMVVCWRGEGVARPGLITRRPPALDSKARDNFTPQGRCCACEEKGRVGEGDGGRWVCLEGGSQDPLPGGLSKTPTAVGPPPTPTWDPALREHSDEDHLHLSVNFCSD